MNSPIRPRLKSLLGAAAALSAISSVAFAAPESTRITMDTARIPKDHPRAKLIESFIANLPIHRDTRDSNLYYWTPTFRTSNTFSASLLEDSTVVELNDALAKLNLKIETLLDAALDNELNARPTSENLDGAAAAAVISEASADIANAGGSTRESTALNNTVDLMFSGLTPRQLELYKANFAFAHVKAGFPVPDTITNDAVKILMKQAKKHKAANLTLRLRGGMSEEQVELFNDYKSLYPEFKWNVLAAGGEVTANADQLTKNPGSQGISESLLAPAAMFIDGSKVVNHGDTTINFSISYTGVVTFLKKWKNQGDYAFPIRFSQTVEYPDPVSVKVNCRYNWSLVDTLSVTVDRTPQGGNYTHASGGTVDPALVPMCNRVADGGDPTPEEMTVIRATEAQWLEHYSSRRQASVSLRNQIMSDLISQLDAKATQALPQEMRSRVVKKLTQECRTDIQKVCQIREPIFNGCIQRISIPIPSCANVEKDITEFYKVDLPIHFHRSDKFQAGFDETQSFEFTNVRRPVMNVQYGNDVCVVFKNDPNTGAISCNQAQTNAARENARDN